METTGTRSGTPLKRGKERIRIEAGFDMILVPGRDIRRMLLRTVHLLQVVHPLRRLVWRRIYTNTQDSEDTGRGTLDYNSLPLAEGVDDMVAEIGSNAAKCDIEDERSNKRELKVQRNDDLSHEPTFRRKELAARSIRT